MARKNGVQNATGDYILFLDADDEFLPNAFEFLLKKLNTTKSDIIEFAYLGSRAKSPSLPVKN